MDSFLFKNELPGKSKDHIFGCANKETGEFYTQKADGIIGFGSQLYRENSSNPPNIIETELYEGRMTQHTFSLCFGHNGGQLTLGDWNSFLHLNKEDENKISVIKTTSLGSNPWGSQYRVPVYSVDIDGDKIEYDYEAMNHGRTVGEGAFFDSGTTLIYVSHKFYDLLEKKMEKFCLKNENNCAGMNQKLGCYTPSELIENIDDFYNTFPSINFDFNAEKVYRLHPQDYFLKNDEYSYCIGIHPLKDMILGGLFWRNYDIKIDKKNKTVSFVRADCAGTNEVIDTRGNDVKQNIIDNPHNADWTIKNVATKYTNTRSWGCLLYTSPSPRDGLLSRMPSSA